MGLTPWNVVRVSPSQDGAGPTSRGQHTCLAPDTCSAHNTLHLSFPSESDSCAPALCSRTPGAVLWEGSRARGREEQVLPGPNAASLLRDAALKPRTTKPQVALPDDRCPSLMCRREGQELRHSTRTSQQNQKERSVFHSGFSATACGLATQECPSKEA